MFYWGVFIYLNVEFVFVFVLLKLNDSIVKNDLFSLCTCPVNGLVAQHIVESKCPVTLNRGRDALSFTSCNDSGVIVNDTG